MRIENPGAGEKFETKKLLGKNPSEQNIFTNLIIAAKSGLNDDD